MISLLEIVGNLAAPAATIVTYSFLRYRFSIKPDAEGKYRWKQIYSTRDAKFHCPKCACPIREQPKICGCNAHHTSHFHFMCKGNEPHCCGATLIMRTQDDC